MPDPLELESRRRIYHCIVRAPGMYLRELQRELGMAMGALEHHLDYLVEADLVTVLHEDHKRFFPTTMDRRDKRTLAFLRQQLPRRILVLVLEERPGPCSKARLVDILRRPASTLNYHLGHLVREGLLEARREGREATYAVPQPDRVFRLLVAHRASLLDRMVDAFLEGTDALR